MLLNFWTGLGAFITGPLVQPFIGLATVVLGGLVTSLLHNQKDALRAQQIATIAKDIAAALVAESAGADWATMLQKLIEQLAAALPTANPTVIARVAKAALIGAGVKPS